jgi:hypothetical protein
MPMGQVVVVDDVFCFLHYPPEKMVRVLPMELIELELNNRIRDLCPIPHDFKLLRYLSAAPWSEDFDSWRREYAKEAAIEYDIQNLIVDIFKPTANEFEFKQNKLSPQSLTAFLSCFAWINKNFSFECFVLENGEHNFTVSLRSSGFLSKTKTGTVFTFRYKEFESLRVSGFSQFTIFTKIGSYTNILENR